MKEKKSFRSSRFWSNVIALMNDAGFTESQLSELLGFKTNYIQTAAKNSGVPSVAVALSIAELFNVTVEELSYGAVGLELRKRQLENELKKIQEEIDDVRKDLIADGLEKEKK